MKIEKFHYSHELVRQYESLIKSIWHEDFLEDFKSEKIASEEFMLYIAYKNGSVL